MKIRMHVGGGLEAAMKTVTDVSPTIDAVKNHLVSKGLSIGDDDLVEVSYYGRDDRIGWDTYAVTLNGAIYAWTDGPVDGQDK